MNLHIYRRSVPWLVLLTILLQALVVGSMQGQQKADAKIEPDEEKFQAYTITPYRPAALQSVWNDLNKDAAWKALVGEATKRGYKLSSKAGELWGQKSLVTVEKAGSRKADVKIFGLETENKESKDAAALVIISDGKRTYKALLIAPQGDVEKAMEYTVEKSGTAYKVIETHSWWSCLKKKLKNKCSGACGTALVTCIGVASATGPFSWATYIGCVAASCGACFAYWSWYCAW